MIGKFQWLFRRGVLVLGSSCTVLFFAALASAAEIVRIEPMTEGSVKAKSFSLTQPAQVQIDAVGLTSNYNNNLLVYAWVLDAATRRPVWVMQGEETERSKNRALRHSAATLDLAPGTYEVYLYAGSIGWGSVHLDGKWESGDFLGTLFGGDNADRLDKYLADCYVSVSSSSSSVNAIQTSVTGELPNALFRSTRMRDGDHAEWNFKIDKPMSLRIYSLIEQPEGYGNPVDGGWIIDLASRKRVWELDRWETERAGGAKKNRLFDAEVRLQPGRYALHYVTDDSHSFEGFNDCPPYDPFNWGITVLPGTDFSSSSFSKIVPAEKGKPIIDFTRARNDDAFEQALRISATTRVHVVAVGEFDSGSEEFVDFGLIENAQTGRPVFEMTFDNTEHAGGAEKNRIFDGELELAPGDYVATYTTDGSHAYRDWNAGAPYDARAWGMAIYPVEGNAASAIAPIAVTEISNDKDLLVSISRVRDNENREEEFQLASRSRIRIYALGEGIDGDMADYGWIEDKRTGRVVWEMTYRNTRSAGGASKNRLYDDTVLLEAGSYIVYYVTDDSHAYNEWNSTPPRDKRNWGISISKADQ